MKVAIIGAGFSGILMGCRLREAGLEFVILEKAAKPGGTWRDNTYPGVACDIPSYLYCSSGDLNPDWSRLYAPGAEILQYLEGLIEKRRIGPSVRYGFEVMATQWDGRRWRLTSKDGRVAEADAVVSATGVLHHPARPPIKGLNEAAFPIIHSAQWRDDVPLDGARVGIIGSGTTATQLTVAIANRVATLTVFQRTPSWILDVPNRESPKLLRWGLRRMPLLYRSGNRLMTWLTTMTYGNSFVGNSRSTRWYLVHRCRRSLRRVTNQELRRKLTPTYAPGCKRFVFSSGYYQAIQRPNVELVTESIARAVADGLITIDGRHHGLDLLILATGFRTNVFMKPMSVTGLNGISIDEVWAVKPIAYRSISIPHMPNFFMLIGPHSPIANMSVVEVAEWQIEYIMKCIEISRRENVAISATEAATAEYVKTLDSSAPRTVWASGCASWYLGPDRLPILYTRPPMQHRRECLEKPDLRDFDVFAKS
jgi:cation diffusion facilitator CzcD-associated flavoprotein CzcO